MSALEVHGLTKRYGKALVVDDLTFSVQPGQIFGFLGPNGSGKTTTIGMIFDVINPTDGTISMFGRSNREALAERRLLCCRSSILDVAAKLRHRPCNDTPISDL